jgi:hypothetical protein
MFVQVGNSCDFPISIVAVSSAHRTVNGRSANDPGGGIGWNASTMGDAPSTSVHRPYWRWTPTGIFPQRPTKLSIASNLH